MIRHLTAKDFRTMAWANGKGVTVEMLKIERDGRLVLRLSRAMVVENGPFSLFPGIERNLTVLSGPGFDLKGEGIDLQARLLQPVAFPGDVPVRAEHVAAASEDFNVMTDRSLPRPEVWVQQAGEIAGRVAALSLRDGAVARHDLILSDEGLRLDFPAIIVRWSGEGGF